MGGRLQRLRQGEFFWGGKRAGGGEGEDVDLSGGEGGEVRGKEMKELMTMVFIYVVRKGRT